MYVDEGIKVCRPGNYKFLKPGDSVVINPALLKAKSRTAVFPPLSLLTTREEDCEVVESPAWVDEYTITGNERILGGSGKLVFIRGEIRIEEPKFVPGFTFTKFVPKFEGEIYEECGGIPLVTASGKPLISLTRESVKLCVENPDTLLLALAYASFYYL